MSMTASPPFTIAHPRGGDHPTIHVTRFHPTLDVASLTACLSHDQSIHLGTLRAPWPYTEQDAKSSLVAYAQRTPAEQDRRLAIRLGSPDAPVVGTISWRPEELPRDQTTPVDACAHVVWGVGYWLATPYRGQGILPAVLEHVVKKVAWEQRDVVARVEVGCFVGNVASRRVAEKAGFVLEGIRRGALVKGGEVRDEAVDSWIPARNGADSLRSVAADATQS